MSSERWARVLRDLIKEIKMTDHMTLASNSVTWQSKAGASIEVRVSLIEETTDHDGELLQPVRARGGLRIVVSGLIDGRERCGHLRVWRHAKGELVADVGEVIGLNAERLAAVQAAIASIKDHPSWIQDRAAAAANQAMRRAVEAGEAAIYRAMGE